LAFDLTSFATFAVVATLFDVCFIAVVDFEGFPSGLILCNILLISVQS
jgi:hypothetical protein